MKHCARDRKHDPLPGVPHPWCTVHWTQFLAYGYTGEVQDYVQAIHTIEARKLQSANINGKGADGALFRHLFDSTRFQDAFREMYGWDFQRERHADAIFAIWVLRDFSPICCLMSEEERMVIYERYSHRPD